jgi:hypothetical protein
MYSANTFSTLVPNGAVCVKKDWPSTNPVNSAMLRIEDSRDQVELSEVSLTNRISVRAIPTSDGACPDSWLHLR